MMVGRAVIRPAKLDYRRPDRAAASLGPTAAVIGWRTGCSCTLLVIALTGFLLEGIRIAIRHPGYGGTSSRGGWSRRR